MLRAISSTTSISVSLLASFSIPASGTSAPNEGPGPDRCDFFYNRPGRFVSSSFGSVWHRRRYDLLKKPAEAFRPQQAQAQKAVMISLKTGWGCFGLRMPFPHLCLQITDL